MIVLVIIGMGSMAAAPSMLRAARQKKLYAVTAGVAGVIGEARLRAMGRGAAHIVDIDLPNNIVRVIEAVDAAGVPVGDCFAATAAGAPALTRVVDAYNWNDEAIATTNSEVAVVAAANTIALAVTNSTNGRFGFCITASGATGRTITSDPTVIASTGWVIGLPPFQVVVRPKPTFIGMTRTLSVGDFLRSPEVTAQ